MNKSQRQPRNLHAQGRVRCNEWTYAYEQQVRALSELRNQSVPEWTQARDSLSELFILRNAVENPPGIPDIYDTRFDGDYGREMMTGIVDDVLLLIETLKDFICIVDKITTAQ